MSDYDHMTNADVMGADELAEYDRDAEFRLDAEDEARALREEAEAAARAAEAGDPDDCGGEFIDGSWYGCGECEVCLSTAEMDGSDRDEEWIEGSCDRCAGSTQEDIERAATEAFAPVCACAIGQGASLDECVCGPQLFADDEGAEQVAVGGGV